MRRKTQFVDFEILKGKVLIDIEINEDEDEITFTDSEGVKYLMYHEQDCCEEVNIEDICGDINNLLNTPIVLAEEVISNGEVEDEYCEDYSCTWTFYKLATINGYVTIRWYGVSNGYYSETVDMVKL